MLTGLSCLSVSGVSEIADFVGDSYGNTNLWELSGTGLDGYGRKFSDGGDAIASPVYGGAVVRASVSAKMFSAGDGSALKVEARSSGSGDWRELCRMVFVDNSATNGMFAFSRADNWRQFRLVFEKGKGTLRVGSFGVEWRADGEVAVPQMLKARDVTANSFGATWSIDESVDGFLFDCWRESMTPWSGMVKWTETFAQCVNGNKSPRKLTSETFDQYTDNAGWNGDFVYVPAEADGTIQLNKASESVGWLVSPELPAMGPVELVVRARAVANQPDHSMPAFLIRGGVTNVVGSFELTASFADFHCPVPEICAGDRLAFRSFSVGSQRRVLIDAVSFVEGFASGYAVTNAVCEGVFVEYSEHPGFHVEDLDPGSDYGFSVRAVSGGEVSAPSPTCLVVTESSGSVEDSTAWPGAAASEITHAAFRLDWPSVAGAAVYRVSVWTNVLQGASPGLTKWSESFSKAMASSSYTAVSNEKFGENYADDAGWTVVSNVYPSVDAGSVRIGNTSRPGELAAPSVRFPAGCTLRVLARRQTASEGAIFSVWRRSGESLSAIGDPCEIGETATECLWALPEMDDGDCLVFRSATGKGSYRTILDEVEVLDGYSAGSPVPDCAVDAAETGETTFSVSDMPTEVWTYAVEAVDGSGAVVAAATNRVDLTNPPPQPVLDAVAMSGLRRRGGVRIWQEDFGAFTNVFAAGKNSADWLNGTTLPHWQAYCGVTAVEGVTRNNGAWTQKGLYAYWATNKLASTYSLGVMTTGTAEDFVYGLAFRNDTAFAARKISIRYDGVQFGFRNDGVHELVCECLVTNELVSVADDGDWRQCDGLLFRTTKDRYSGLDSGKDLPAVTNLSAEVFGASVPEEWYFMLRWRRSAVPSAAAMAIDNIEVSFTVQPRPMTVVVR